MRAQQGQRHGDRGGEEGRLEQRGEEGEGEGPEEVVGRGLRPVPAEEDGLERREGVL